jgi:hypothetical protein
MKRRILAILSVLPLVAFLLLPVVVLLAPVERIECPGGSTLFLRNGPCMTVCRICRWAYALRRAFGKMHTMFQKTRIQGVPLASLEG